MKTALENLLAGLPDRPVAVDLGTLALIEVTGEDAQSFLHGQFSNEVAALGDASNQTARCQLNAYCNPKGRVLALIRLIRHGGGFGMIVPATLAAGLIARLKMFVLRARVRIAPRPETALLGLLNAADDGSGAGLESAIDRVPVDGVLPRQLLLGEKPAIESVARAHERRPDDDLWRLTDILSGIPQIYAPTIEAFIPQMINLDQVGGLSFTKGCYPGQEIVARLRYRGKVKQRMLAAVAHGLECPAPGDRLYSDRRGAQKIGVVVDAVATGEDRHIMSATAPADLAEEETLRLGAPAGPALMRIPMPHAAAPE